MVVAPLTAVGVSMAVYLAGNRDSDLCMNDLVKSSWEELGEVRRIMGRQCSRGCEEPCDPATGKNTPFCNAVIAMMISTMITLDQHEEFVERVARLLDRKGRLSAAQLAFWIRDYNRRLERMGEGPLSSPEADSSAN